MTSFQLTQEYWPSGSDKIKDGIGAALRTILEKKVVPSLEPLLENPKLEPELRTAIQDNLMVLLHRNKWESGGDVVSVLNPVNNGSSVSEAVHTGTGFPPSPGIKDVPETLHLNYNINPVTSSGLLSPDIASATIQSFPTSAISAGTLISGTTATSRGLASTAPQSAITFENSSSTFTQDEPNFSDEEDDEDDDDAVGTTPKANGKKDHSLQFSSLSCNALYIVASTSY